MMKEVFMVSYLRRGPAISDLDTFLMPSMIERGNALLLLESFLLLPMVAALAHQIT